jgi:hypothetical protein
MAQEFQPGDQVVVSWRIGTIVRKSRMGRAEGYDVSTVPTDPSEGWLPHFVQDYLVKPAIVGETICREPRGSHWCGLIHVEDPSQYPIKEGK